MSKTVIVAKNAKTGLRKVFRTADDAAEFIGVTPAAVSAASIDRRETAGWTVIRVDRVLAVHVRVHKLWMVATEDRRGRLIEYGNPDRVFSKKEIDMVKDVTAAWYLQDEEEGR